MEQITIKCAHCGATNNVQPDVEWMSAVRRMEREHAAMLAVVQAARLTVAGPDAANYERLANALDTAERLHPDYEAIADTQELETLREEVERLKAQRGALLTGIKGALAALTQPATYPADIEAARAFLRAAIATAEQEGA